MTPTKLEALRVLAADERTPIEEARNAALAFVRGGGKAEADSVPKDAFDKLRALCEEGAKEMREVKQRMQLLLEERNKTFVERDRLAQENASLRAILEKIIAGRRAEDEAAKLLEKAPEAKPQAKGRDWYNNAPGYFYDPFKGHR